jgi:hypothetical protein
VKEWFRFGHDAILWRWWESIREGGNEIYLRDISTSIQCTTPSRVIQLHLSNIALHPGQLRDKRKEMGNGKERSHKIHFYHLPLIIISIFYDTHGETPIHARIELFMRVLFSFFSVGNEEEEHIYFPIFPSKLTTRSKMYELVNMAMYGGLWKLQFIIFLISIENVKN